MNFSFRVEFDGEKGAVKIFNHMLVRKIPLARIVQESDDRFVRTWHSQDGIGFIVNGATDGIVEKVTQVAASYLGWNVTPPSDGVAVRGMLSGGQVIYGERCSDMFKASDGTNIPLENIIAWSK